MNILFLTIAYDNNRNIYSDLMHEFRDKDHVVWVTCQMEHGNNQDTHLQEENGINILRVSLFACCLEIGCTRQIFKEANEISCLSF